MQTKEKVPNLTRAKLFKGNLYFRLWQLSFQGKGNCHQRIGKEGGGENESGQAGGAKLYSVRNPTPPCWKREMGEKN